MKKFNIDNFCIDDIFDFLSEHTNKLKTKKKSKEKEKNPDKIKIQINI